MKILKVPLFIVLTLLNGPVNAAVLTYQGRLANTGTPVNGNVALEFRLFAAPAGATALWSEQHPSVGISNGLFAVTLGQSNPLADSVFDGADRWLGITINGGAELTPRTLLAAAPYAISARQVTGVIGSSSLAGTYGNAIVLNNGANQFSGTFVGNGAGLFGVHAATLGGRVAGDFWQLSGNAGTTAGNHFMGTTDNGPLEFRVNNQRALRLEPTSMAGAVNVIGGAAGNAAAANVYGVTIAGGGGNNVNSPYGVVGGGSQNVIGSGSQYSTIGGGLGNDIGASSYCSALGAGENKGGVGWGGH